MVVDQQLDQRIRLRAARASSRAASAFPAPSEHLSGLLAGIELGVDEEAVLEVVDAERGGLGIGHRAQMAGDLRCRRCASSIAALSSARVMFM